MKLFLYDDHGDHQVYKHCSTQSVQRNILVGGGDLSILDHDVRLVVTAISAFRGLDFSKLPWLPDVFGRHRKCRGLGAEKA